MLIVNSALVEVNFSTAPAAGAQVKFNDQQLMHNCKIIGVEGVSASQLTTAPSTAAIATQANCIKTALTLQNKRGVQFVFQLPFGQIITQNNSGIIKEFYGLDLDWQSCLVNIFATGVTAGQSICYNFYYVRNAMWKDYLKARQMFGRMF